MSFLGSYIVFKYLFFKNYVFHLQLSIMHSFVQLNIWQSCPVLGSVLL